MTDKEQAKIECVNELQGANIRLCNAYFTLEGHASPAFELEMSQIQERIREMIVAVERLR